MNKFILKKILFLKHTFAIKDPIEIQNRLLFKLLNYSKEIVENCVKTTSK